MRKRVREYLRVVFAIFVRDLKRVVRNPLALILLLGACALPSAYAWWCTAANWDPYQNTEGIRIAVANEDTGSQTPETGKINIGDELIAKLKDNHELGWAFYDNADEAVNSVYSGESYAAIVLPKNFSSDFTSVLSGDFKHPQIDYYLNEKISASAPDFTNEGADVIQNEINESFVDAVSKTIFGITQKFGAKAEDEANKAQGSLSSGVARANKAISTARDSMEKIDPAVDDVRVAADKAEGTLASMHDSIPSLKATLKEARKSLRKTRSAAEKYGDKLTSAMTKSAMNLAKASAEAQNGVSSVAANLNKAYGESSAALEIAQGIADQNDSLISSLEAMAGTNPDLLKIVADFKRSNTNLKDTISSLKSANNALNNTLVGTGEMLTAINSKAKQGASDIESAAATLRKQVLPRMNASLDDYADMLGTLSGMVEALGPAIDQSRSAIDALKQSLDQAKDSINAVSSSLSGMSSNLNSTLNDLVALENSSNVRGLAEYLKIDPSQAASFISSPVKLSTTNIYPVKNYGSGVVAFFTSVALWVAGFVFIDLLKMRVDPKDLPKFTERQAYYGRWLLFMTLGLLPPIIVCTGDLILGIQCENPPAFMFAGIVSALVYVNLIYALAHAFRYIGKALAVLLLIVQIPGSSGLYPIEMMPDFYQAIHPLLPFTYTIDAFRESIGGFYGANYWIDLCILVLVFVPIGTFIGTTLGRWASNLTLLLDREIGRTDMFDGETISKNMRLRPSTLLNALVQAPEYRTQMVERAKWFKRSFPRLKTIGWIAFIGQFVITFALMIIIQADVNTKLVLLMAMVIGIIVVDTYLIVISYTKANLSSKMSLLNLPQNALAAEIRKTYGGATVSHGAGTTQHGSTTSHHSHKRGSTSHGRPKGRGRMQ